MQRKLSLRWSRSAGVFTAAAVLPLVLLLAGCGHHGSSSEPTVKAAPPKPVVVTVAPLEARSVQRRIAVVGNLHGLERLQISAKVAGRLEKVLVDVGDRVQPGASLVEINETDFKLAVDEAQRSLERELAKLGLTEMPGQDFDIEKLPTMIRGRLLVENARRRFERVRNLFQKNAGTNEELDKAETELRVEESNFQQTQLDVRSTIANVRYSLSVLDTARRQLAETKIAAPASEFPSVADLKMQGIGYVVSKRMATAGELTSAGSSPLVELVIDDALKLKATVPERYASEVRLRQTVEVRVEAYPNDVFAARVTRISPTVDSDSRTFEIEAVVPNNDHRLQHGSFAKAAIVTRTADQAMTVPIESLITYAGVTKIFCLDGDKVRDVPVQLGIRGEGWVEVIGDIPAQGMTVTSGQTQLAAGSLVTVRAPLAARPQVIPASSHPADMAPISGAAPASAGPMSEGGASIVPASAVEPTTAAPESTEQVRSVSNKAGNR